MKIVPVEPITLNPCVIQSAGAPPPKELRSLGIVLSPLILLGIGCIAGILLQMIWLWLACMAGAAGFLVWALGGFQRKRPPHLQPEARLHAFMHVDLVHKLNEAIGLWNRLLAEERALTSEMLERFCELLQFHTALSAEAEAWIQDPKCHYYSFSSPDLYVLALRLRAMGSSCAPLADS